MTRKGIILAGGRGTRLFPLTLSVSKQLLPVHDKPMIYYPLSTLMLAGIRDILVITTPRDAGAFKALLGDGSGLGIRLSYAVQPEPGGVAQALLIGDEFIGGNPVCLILGDNIFFGRGLASGLRQANARTDGATLFACKVADPERYGVVSLDRRGRATGIEEKPGRPKSNFAVTGVYFFDHGVGDIARQLRPSARGELEITDVLSAYLAAGTLRTDVLGRGMIWHDTGTHEALQRAASGVQALEARRGRKIACVEEVAWRMGFINDPQLRRLAEPLMKSGYGGYLQSLLNDVSLSQAV